MRPHPAEEPHPTDPELHRPEHDVHETDAARMRRIQRANAVAWVIRKRGAGLTAAQLSAIEEILR